MTIASSSLFGMPSWSVAVGEREDRRHVEGRVDGQAHAGDQEDLALVVAEGLHDRGALGLGGLGRPRPRRPGDSRSRSRSTRPIRTTTRGQQERHPPAPGHELVLGQRVEERRRRRWRAACRRSGRPAARSRRSRACPRARDSIVISAPPAHSPPTEIPCSARSATSRIGASSPTLAYVGRQPIATVEPPISSSVMTSIALRPMRSPKWPKIAAPTGRKRKPDAEGGERRQHAHGRGRRPGRTGRRTPARPPSRRGRSRTTPPWSRRRPPRRLSGSIASGQAWVSLSPRRDCRAASAEGAGSSLKTSSDSGPR